MASSETLRDLDAFLIDMDGVLFHGTRDVPGAAAFLQYLLDSAIAFRFLTNNSTRTPQQYVERLAQLGVRVEPAQVVTSALVAATVVSQPPRADRAVYLVGEAGIREALRARGLRLTEDHQEATDVVIGLDRSANYEKLARAALAVGRGARFIATNTDRSFPSERGFEPGAGALVAVIETTTGMRPTSCGKPEPAMFEMALGQLHTAPGRTAMVGDRYETDIAGAAALGLVTIAVLGGATSREALERARPAPDFICPSVRELHAALVAASNH